MFFLDGMTNAMQNLVQHTHPAYPVTIYYAFKQSETESEGGISSTGWETFLEAVLKAGFALTGTWPMRTELGNRMIGSGTRANASKQTDFIGSFYNLPQNGCGFSMCFFKKRPVYLDF